MVAVLCAAFASSCGGGGGVASCGKVSPCGGDPVGAWKFAGQCANTAAGIDSNDFCPTATASVAGLSVSGTATFSADSSYTMNIKQSGTVRMTIPASCLSQGGITFTCAQLQQSIQAALADDPDSPVASVTCAGAGGCTCSMTMSSTTSQSGTWTAEGTMLSLSGGDSGEFCVKDKELHLITVDTTMTMGTMGQAKITSDIVAVKQ
jgi:hypothetical protein